jgi:hypothetical protein
MLEAVFIAVTMAPATQRVERPQTSHPPHHPVPLERLYNVRQPRAVETPQRGVSAGWVRCRKGAIARPRPRPAADPAVRRPRYLQTKGGEPGRLRRGTPQDRRKPCPTPSPRYAAPRWRSARLLGAVGSGFAMPSAPGETRRGRHGDAGTRRRGEDRRRSLPSPLFPLPSSFFLSASPRLRVRSPGRPAHDTAAAAAPMASRG